MSPPKECNGHNDSTIIYSPTEYWLIFVPSKNKKHYFLHKKINHVIILMRDEGVWVVLDPKSSRGCLAVLEYGPKEDVPSYYKKTFECEIVFVKLMNISQPNRYSPWLRFFSCTLMAQYLMGTKWFIFTPYQLYKKLLRCSQNELLNNGIRNVASI